MAFDFNIDEILKMAEQIEENGVKFYTEAAEAASDSSHKEMLLELAGFEKEHKKHFASIREKLSEAEKKGLIFDPEDESAWYLKSLSDMRVFFEKKINIKSLTGILKAAIEVEKESILFYHAIKPLVHENFGREKVNHIIKEEMLHIRMLTDKLKETK